MLFQTFEFGIFFLITAVLVCFTRGRVQRVLLLCASLFFYACGSIQHLFVFILVIVITYLFGIAIEKKRNKIIFSLSIFSTFIPLFIFKYLNFVVSQIFSGGVLFHIMNSTPSPHIALTLPVGISFYTFQAAGYLIDIWRKEQPAEKNIIHYALFLSFFPQLVAGPIERSKHLLTQLKKETVLSYDNTVYGLRLMGLGLFLKCFVADTLGYIVDQTYDNPGMASGILLLVSTFAFGVQIYCDFNGYSLVARGSAKILGVDLVKNFNRPYFSKSVSEFWRRWHISLSFWFRDYVYIPLGGSRCSKKRHYLNLFITFALSGIWHGADWTFAIWGALNGVYLIVEDVFHINRSHASRWKNICGLLYAYFLINMSWIFFRANSFNDVKTIIAKIIFIPFELAGLLNGNFSSGSSVSIGKWNAVFGLFGAVSVFLLSLYERKNRDICSAIGKQPVAVRWTGYFLLIFTVLCFGKFGSLSSAQFVYFRF
jgi:D-alanyl-lipoteichoic acid acyltransferase DltB (MBOAT superfamily)